MATLVQIKSEVEAKIIMKNKKYQHFIIHDKAIIACLEQNKTLTDANLLYEIELIQSKSILLKLKRRVSSLLQFT